MKNSLFFFSLAVLSICFSGCKKTGDKFVAPNFENPLTAAAPVTKITIDNALLQCYVFLDGVYKAQPAATWETGSDNWIYGSVAGGEAYKGSNLSDQGPAEEIATFIQKSTNIYFNDKWNEIITALHYTNNVLKDLPLTTDPAVTPAYAAEVTAEARFLRGFYELELAKLWRNVPYINETAVYNKGYNGVGNPGPIWINIEADFTAAMNVLPLIQASAGRPNKYAAEAFLVKAMLFDHKYSQAKPLLTDLITNGVTSKGTKYTLVPYAYNFNPSTQNRGEGVFVIQAKVHDGSDGYDGNSGDMLNFPNSGLVSCCGFFRPSFSFVNAFKTDAVTGLPMLDTYNNTDLKNDQGLSSATSFIPSTATIDSRLDWTVGRRGIPCLDWGIMAGQDWVRAQPDGGPYFNLKTLFYKAAEATTAEAFGGWATNQSTSNCYNAIRFADVLLWAAEVEVEVGSLQTAENYVNKVRARAATPSGWVHTYKDPTNPASGYTTIPAANYKVGLYGAAGGYPATGFATGGKSYARKAVFFERMLELGMEGHRFFDLQRWDGLYGGPAGTGYMAATLNAYLAHEGAEPNFTAFPYSSARFTAGKNELYPIPQNEITLANGKLKQNPGY